MKRFVRFGLFASVIVLSVLVLWCGGAYLLWRPEARTDVARLLPPEVSLAFRITEFKRAFDRHWQARGQLDSDDAVEQVLRALGIWDDWVADYGRTGARLRTAAYRTAFYELLGEEAWIVFGRWPSEETEEGSRVGLVLYLREDSFLKSRIIPLADLLFPGYGARTTDYRELTIHEYSDEDDENSFTAATIGGWLCVALSNPGPDAVMQMIDQYHDGPGGGDGGGFRPPDLGGEGETAKPSVFTDSSALSLLFYPGPFWDQLDQLMAQSDVELTEESVITISSWAQRLEGIDEVRVAQTGRSLTNLDLSMTGRRVRYLDAVSHGGRLLAPRSDPPIAAADDPRGACILQLDLDYPFAVWGLPLFGFHWDGLVQDLEDLGWIAPKVGETLRGLLLEDEVPTEGRFGLGFFSVELSPFPIVWVWEDRVPLMRTERSPADTWRMIEPSVLEREGDLAFVTADAELARLDPTPLMFDQQALADGLWSRSDSMPLAYVTVHFDELAQWMERFPTLVLSSDDRPAWRNLTSLAHGIRLGIGSLALRVDRSEDELRLSFRTLEHGTQ